jgi:hypothetical protein
MSDLTRIQEECDSIKATCDHLRQRAARYPFVYAVDQCNAVKHAVGRIEAVLRELENKPTQVNLEIRYPYSAEGQSEKEPEK